MKHTPDLFRPGFTHFNPFRELNRIQRQMDQFFDEFSPMMRSSQNVASMNEFTPSCDVEERDHHFVMTFDLPGVKKEDIRIDLRENTLTVSGDRKHECEQKGKNHYHSERFYGSFTRSFQLPNSVKPEQIETHYADGVLRVAVPMSEGSKSQQIRIAEGKQTGFWDKLLGQSKEESKSQIQEKRSSDKVA